MCIRDRAIIDAHLWASSGFSCRGIDIYDEAPANKMNSKVSIKILGLSIKILIKLITN